MKCIKRLVPSHIKGSIPPLWMHTSLLEHIYRGRHLSGLSHCPVSPGETRHIREDAIHRLKLCFQYYYSQHGHHQTSHTWPQLIPVQVDPELSQSALRRPPRVLYCNSEYWDTTRMCTEPYLYSLFTQDCVPAFATNNIVKFDMIVIGLILINDAAVYRVQVLNMVSWCSENNCISIPQRPTS